MGPAPILIVGHSKVQLFSLLYFYTPFMKGWECPTIFLSNPHTKSNGKWCPDVHCAKRQHFWVWAGQKLLLHLYTLYHPPCFICLHSSYCHPILYILLISLFGYCLLLLLECKSLNLLCLFYSLLYPQFLEDYLACPVAVRKMQWNEGLKVSRWGRRSLEKEN